MKKIAKVFSGTIAFLLLSTAAFTQNVVTGKVTDSKDGSPVSGVTVTVSGTKVATQTGADGTYQVTVPAGASSLAFSSVGYAKQVVAIGGRKSVDVSFVTANQQLNEVVVVAYGTRKKSDLTGAVTAVTAKEFQKGAIASSEQLLQGKVAGLQITNGGGSAGGGSTIRIRGGASLNASNDPLIVIDGVPVASNDISGSPNLLNSINPNDIESMSVLKDASATALYGSRASNGVIIITTKKGSKGKVKFSYSTQFSSATAAKKADVLTGDEIRKIVTDKGDAGFISKLGTANTDWQDQIFQTANGYDNNISAGGSIGKLPFRVSLGYLDQAGILKTDKFNRLSSAINLSPKFLNDHLSVNINAKFSKTKYRFADNVIGAAVRMDPTQPVYSDVEDESFNGVREWMIWNNDTKRYDPVGLATRNPLALLTLHDNRSTVRRFIGNIQLDYKLHCFPDLHIMANLGMDNTFGKGDDKWDSASSTNWRTKGRFAHYAQYKKNTLADVSLFYAKDIKSINSKIDVLVGHSYQDFVTDVMNYDAYGRDGKVLPRGYTFATDKPENRLESYLARMNFTLANKYLLTASVRRDASSKFSPENRVGYFPAVAFAWKLKDEFFSNSGTVNDLKLRLGWGLTGQQDNIDQYYYLQRYSLGLPTAQYQFGETFYMFTRPSAYNDDLRWESTTTSNIGLDFAFFNSRITGSVDAYYKKTKDLLSTITVAPGVNFDIAVTSNIGNMENKGIEFSVNTIPVKSKDITWEFGGNVTYNKSEVTNLFNPDPNFKGYDVSGISGGTGNNIGKVAVGYAPNVFNVYKQVYDKTTGAPIQGLYEDINRDGKIDGSDRYFYKKPSADVLLGLTTQVTYKKWSIGAAGHGSIGNYLYNNFASDAGSLRNITDPINYIANVSRVYLDTRFTNNQYLSDYYIENASYFRLDNINLGFNAGKILRNQATLRVNASIQNVLVITKYKGLDPENSATSGANFSGVDNNIYPRPRTLSLGVNLDF